MPIPQKFMIFFMNLTLIVFSINLLKEIDFAAPGYEIKPLKQCFISTNVSSSCLPGSSRVVMSPKNWVSVNCFMLGNNDQFFIASAIRLGKNLSMR